MNLKLLSFLALALLSSVSYGQYTPPPLATPVGVGYGGTGLATYTAGDILYASGATTLAKLLGVATGNALISGGVGAAPSYGKITTAHTTGIAASGANTDITSLAGTTMIGINTTATDRPLDVNSATGLGIRITHNDSNGSAVNYVDYQVTSGGDASITPSGGDTNVTGTVNVTAGALATSLRTSGTNTGSSWAGRIIAGGATSVFLMGQYNDQAWLGAHNAALGAWADMYINPDGTNLLRLGDKGGATIAPDPILTISNSTFQTTISTTTASTTKDTGALVLEGGVGLEGNIYGGGNVVMSGTDSSLPNQLADEADDIMTRGLSDARYTTPTSAIATYGAGTSYTLTDAPAAVDLGTTDPTVTITGAAGLVRKISGQIVFNYNAATFAASRTITVKVRRTNNTAADIANAIVTIQSGTLTRADSETIVIPPVTYTTVGTDDAIAIYVDISTLPTTGSVLVDSVGTYLRSE